MARTTSFLISEELIRELSPIGYDLDFNFMTPHLLTAQDKWIQPKLGTKLYEELMTEIKNASITPDNLLLLNDYTAKPLVHWAMYEAMEFLAVKMVNSGIVQRVVDDGNPITLQDAQRLAVKERDNAEWYTQRLIDYLCANNNLYPLYSQASPGDIKSETANWSGGLNLGMGTPRAGGSSGATPTPGGETYQNPNEVENPFGDVKDFFFLTAKSFSETMAAMFYPLTFPSFVSPFAILSDNAASLIEIGSSINIDFGATFDRGQIILNAAFQDFRSGLPNAYKYTGFGLPANVPSVLLADNQSIIGYTVLIGVQNGSVIVAYDVGPQPLDSQGNPYLSPLPAGDSSPSVVSFEGVYPLYGTTVAITTATKQALVSMISGQNIVFNMVAESGTDKQFFEIPDAWLLSRPLADVETFNTISSAWVGGGLADWTQTAVTETVQGNIINYTRFTYNGVNRGAIDIRLVF